MSSSNGKTDNETDGKPGEGEVKASVEPVDPVQNQKARRMLSQKLLAPRTRTSRTRRISALDGLPLTMPPAQPPPKPETGLSRRASGHFRKMPPRRGTPTNPRPAQGGLPPGVVERGGKELRESSPDPIAMGRGNKTAPQERPPPLPSPSGSQSRLRSGRSARVRRHTGRMQRPSKHDTLVIKRSSVTDSGLFDTPTGETLAGKPTAAPGASSPEGTVASSSTRPHAPTSVQRRPSSSLQPRHTPSAT